MIVVTIEMAGVSGCDAEIARNGKLELRRCCARNRNPQTLEGKWRAADDGAVISVIGKDEIIHHIPGHVIGIADRSALVPQVKPSRRREEVFAPYNRIPAVARI